MKRIVSMILLFALLFTGLSFPAQSVADSDHPITLTITCDPAPELEGEGTIPDLLFTIRNTGSEDYTLHDAKLFGGFEDDEKDIGDSSFTVLAGSSKEFHLTDVPVSEDQLDREIVYRLTWNELETLIDEETGEATFIYHPREATASITIERFVIPELTVTAACAEPYVRAEETFTVTYTISNNTAFDITGIRLYDPEQSMQTIPLPSNELLSGESMTVDAEYKMGTENMTFCPCIEYLSRRREMKTTAAETLTVENVSVDLLVETELRSATAKGNVFAVMITNRGNRPVTDIRVFDEINTQIEEPFSLEPDENYTVVCIIMPAVSADVVRTVRFHVTATDYFGKEFRVDDPGQYQVVPYVEPDSVRLVLSAVLQSPYYNEDGKLCASVQFIIRNNGDVKIHNAVLQELTLFGEVKTYDELLEGDTYLMKVYQLDGVKELRFQVTAVDPAGEPCSSDIIRLDLSGLKELADQKDDAVLVYTQNDYMQDIDTRYTGVLRMATIIGLSVAALCAIICIILYAVEIRIRSKLPAEFEDEMERVLRSTKRRTPKQLFTDAPTEQFGYVAPIKLRNYGELTEEEAKERRALYARRLEENIRKEGAKPNARPQTPANARIDDDGTRVIPVARRTTPEPNKTPSQTVGGTQAIPVVRRTAPEPNKTPSQTVLGTQAVPVVRRTAPEPEHIPEKKPDSTRIIPTVHPKATEPMPDGTQVIPVVRPKETESKPDGTQAIHTVRRTAPEPEHISEKKPDGTRIIPTVHPKATESKPDGTQVIPSVRRTTLEPEHIPEKKPDGTRVIRTVWTKESDSITESVPNLKPERNLANTIVGGDVPGAPPEPEPEQIMDSERNPANTIVGGDVLDVPSKPEPEQIMDSERNPANTIVGDVDLDVPPEPEPIPEWSMEPEPEPDNPPDSLREPPSLAQGGQGDISEPETKSEPDHEPEDKPVSESISEAEPDSVHNPANTIVGGDVLGAPPEPETIPERSMEPKPEPDNPPDSLREPPSLAQGGQGDITEPETKTEPDPEPEEKPIPESISEPEPESECNPANTIVGGDVPGAPHEPEQEPKPSMDPEPEPIPGPEPGHEQESEFANTIVGDVVLDVPPEPEQEPKPSMEPETALESYMDPEPEPDNPSDSLCESPSLTQGGQGDISEPETKTESDPEPEDKPVSESIPEPEPESESELSMDPEPEPIPGQEPERNPANTIVGGDVLDAPSEPEPIPERSMEPETAFEPSMRPASEPEPDNPSDSLRESPSLAQGGQGDISEPETKTEPDPEPEEKPIPESISEPEPESESEWSMEHEPKPDNPPDSLREPPSLIQGGQRAKPDSEPELPQHVSAIRREYEKPVPARRPVELQPIRRIGR